MHTYIHTYETSKTKQNIRLPRKEKKLFTAVYAFHKWSTTNYFVDMTGLRNAFVNTLARGLSDSVCYDLRGGPSPSENVGFMISYVLQDSVFKTVSFR